MPALVTHWPSAGPIKNCFKFDVSLWEVFLWYMSRLTWKIDQDDSVGNFVHITFAELAIDFEISRGNCITD